jgi:DEAD/DEAH box helicase domain-containing protein
MPLVALCDRGDIGGISIPLHPQVRSGCVFIYDGHPGGVGIAARGFECLEDLLGRVLELLKSCPCEEGCPSCVVSPKCGNGNRPLDKPGAEHFLRLLLGKGEESPVEVEAPDPAWSDPDWSPPEAPSGLLSGDRLVWEEEESTGSESLPADLPKGKRYPSRSAPWLDDLEAEAGPSPSPSPAPAPRRRARQAGRGARIFPGPPRPKRSVETVLFDLETVRSAREVGGWGNPHRMRVAIGVACHLQEGRFEVFDEAGVPDLIDRLQHADMVVGFNIRRFDYGVLSGYTGVDYNRTLPTLDLLEDVHRQLRRRISLNALARETLGAEKSADGLQSLEWVKQGRLDLVEEYCRHDVEIMRDLYLFGRRMGHILYRDKQDRVLKLRVDW